MSDLVQYAIRNRISDDRYLHGLPSRPSASRATGCTATTMVLQNPLFLLVCSTSPHRRRDGAVTPSSAPGSQSDADGSRCRRNPSSRASSGRNIDGRRLFRRGSDAEAHPGCHERAARIALGSSPMPARRFIAANAAEEVDDADLDDSSRRTGRRCNWIGCPLAEKLRRGDGVPDALLGGYPTIWGRRRCQCRQSVDCHRPEGRRHRCFVTVDELPEGDREVLRRCGLQSAVVVPLPPMERSARCAGVRVDDTRSGRGPVIEHRLPNWSPLCEFSARARQASQAALQITPILNDRSSAIAPLPTTWRAAAGEGAADAAFDDRRERGNAEEGARASEQLPTPATVLLLGETGWGKDLVSPQSVRGRITGRWSRRAARGDSHGADEDELFGHERGAFTGALSRQIGRFEAAHLVKALLSRTRIW